jgi:hypothetical protein
MHVTLILQLIISYKHNSLCIQIKFEAFIHMVQSISFLGLLLIFGKTTLTMKQLKAARRPSGSFGENGEIQSGVE